MRKSEPVSNAHSMIPTQQIQKQLQIELDQLERTVSAKGFGLGETSIGAELEVSIINGQGQAAPLNQELLQIVQDIEIQAELDLFNLEINSPPVPSAGSSLSRLEDILTNKLNSLRNAATGFDADIAAVGVLPTLTEKDLQPSIMTNAERYKMLSKALRELRGENFTVDIHGPEDLTADCEDVTFEGANTSAQYHLRVEPDRFSRWYNAAHLTTPAVVAISANSPIALGKVLWNESRIALFKQAVDYRNQESHEALQPSRVSFGYGWNKGGVVEAFRENVALFEPIFDLQHSVSPDTPPDKGPPALRALRAHQGTVWSWNRAVYDPSSDGHLRIEFRSLPSGPTPIDLVANAAFAMGVAVGLEPHIEKLIGQIPFRYAETNFYRAAKTSLDAAVFWPSASTGRLRELPITEVIEELLPHAYDGLSKIGVNESDREKYLSVIQGRLAHSYNPAQWWTKQVPLNQDPAQREKTLQKLTLKYVQLSREGSPSHTWPIEA